MGQFCLSNRLVASAQTPVRFTIGVILSASSLSRSALRSSALTFSSGSRQSIHFPFCDRNRLHLFFTTGNMPPARRQHDLITLGGWRVL
jgi:hypothetical protein